jgi:hypothetical protein
MSHINIRRDFQKVAEINDASSRWIAACGSLECFVPPRKLLDDDFCIEGLVRFHAKEIT